MAHTHTELMNKLLPLYEADRERFMRFYNAVYLMLSALAPGQSLRIADHCSKNDISLFRLVAELVILEELNREDLDMCFGFLEPSEDWTLVRRMRDFSPSAPTVFIRKWVAFPDTASCKENLRLYKT